MENSSEVLQEFDILENGSSFIIKNFKRLQEQYPNMFIAVEDNKIIFSSINIEEVINTLNSMKKELSRVLIEFIPQKGLIVLY